MGRSYKRKTQKRDPETLRKAVLDVKNGMHLREASRLYGVPRTSLRRQSKLNTVPQLFANTVPPEQSPNEFPASLELENIVIHEVGRKMVSLFSSVLHREFF